MPIEQFNREEELKAVERRYKNVQSAIPYTLDRLKKDPSFLATVRELKSEDRWKDWHILMAIFNVVMNFHLKQKQADISSTAAQKIGAEIFERLSTQGEKENDPVIPTSSFSYDEMKSMLGFAIMDYLVQKGAVLEGGFKADKVMKIAAKKYHYFDLDVPHEAIFESPENANQ